MKTTISKGNILRQSTLLLISLAFILAALLFTACSDAEGLAGSDDTALIEMSFCLSMLLGVLRPMHGLLTTALENPLCLGCRSWTSSA